MVHSLASRFKNLYGNEPLFIVRAPGRVNLLGEHVDYNGGWVLPVAIDQAVYVAVGRGEKNTVSISTTNLNKKTSFSLSNLANKIDLLGNSLPLWARYPAGVAWALKDLGLRVTGINAVIISDLPIGSGLSSSAALEVSFAVAWKQLGGWSLDPMEMALACQRAENNYVGAMCGIMDQFASIFGEEGKALFLDCLTLKWKPIALPNKTAIVIADTGVRRELGSSQHNVRRAECAQALKILKKVLPNAKVLRDVSVDDFSKYKHLLSPVLEKRAKHVVEECNRMQEAVKILQKADPAAFGKLMNQCHKSLKELYEVSCPELDMMVDLAQKIEGCYGARLTGAGFGGCTVNLVKKEDVESFKNTLKKNYTKAMNKIPEVYACHASNGAAVLIV